MGAAMEYLFQSVRPEVIAEAERQAREAFPEGLPDPNNMVTVHMRWGDKPGEVGEKTPAEYFVAGVERFVQMKGLGGSSPVHVYLASEDEVAIRAFEEKAPRNWRIHPYIGANGQGEDIPDDVRLQRARIVGRAAALHAVESLRPRHNLELEQVD